MSTGFGIGVAYAECQRSFNPTAIPGIKIIKPSSSNQHLFEYVIYVCDKKEFSINFYTII